MSGLLIIMTLFLLNGSEQSRDDAPPLATYQMGRFALRFYDADTIRKSPTTQVAIVYAPWPKDEFLLWLPEEAAPLWNQWTADVAHQDYRADDRGRVVWCFSNPRGAATATLETIGDSALLCEVTIENRLDQEMKHVVAQNCFHLSNAPDFNCDDFSRIHIRTEGAWRTLAELAPKTGLPMYYWPGFLESGLTDSWNGGFVKQNQPQRADHPLIICTDRTATRAVATVSEDVQCLFHNHDLNYLHCIHSQQRPAPTVAPGGKAVFRQIILFVEGGVEASVAGYEEACSHLEKAGRWHSTKLPERH
jgi:hypothetical protein